MTTKISISLPDETVEALDKFVKAGRSPSRSAAISQALQQLTSNTLAEEYAQAMSELEEDTWDQASSDGLQ